MDKDPLSFEDQLRLVLPDWLVDAIGPIDDRFGWPLLLVTLGILAGILHVLTHALNIPLGDGKAFIYLGVTMVLLALLMPKE